MIAHENYQGNFMSRQIQIFQIFVASPSDVSDERNILETVVIQLNQAWGSSLGIAFELVRWETNVHPSFSDDPQSVINDQVPQDYDVFIGILWSRIGTKTPRAQSGTIEEFERAYARFKSTGKSPEIMLYFKDAPIAPSKIDSVQVGKVQEFRQSLSDKGGLYSMFEDQASFESSVRAHLSAVAQKLAGELRTRETPDVGATLSVAGASLDSSEEDDYGYIDYIEVYESRQAEMTAAITAINEATVRIGEQLSQRRSEIESGTPADAKAVRRFIKRAADDMNSYANTLTTQVEVMSDSRKEAFNALSNALVLHGDFQQGHGDLLVLRDTLGELVQGAKIAKESMTGMRMSANGLPRISKELNQAKRAVVTQLDAFLLEVDSTSSTVANIVEAIDRILRSN